MVQSTNQLVSFYVVVVTVAAVNDPAGKNIDFFPGDFVFFLLRLASSYYYSLS